MYMCSTMRIKSVPCVFIYTCTCSCHAANTSTTHLYHGHIYTSHMLEINSLCVNGYMSYALTEEEVKRSRERPFPRSCRNSMRCCRMGRGGEGEEEGEGRGVHGCMHIRVHTATAGLHTAKACSSSCALSVTGLLLDLS